MRADLYISADIEADGPVPGVNSMLAFGLSVAGRFDGRTFMPEAPRARTFYRELRPISEQFDAEALAVSGLDREALLRAGMDPKAALDEASDWVVEVAGKDRAVMVAWTLAYDWLFLQWYFLSFASAASPFGFSSCVDMKTMFWRHAATVLDGAGKDDVPAALRPKAAHTHNALDDAVEQAELFVNLWRADEHQARGAT